MIDTNERTAERSEPQIVLIVAENLAALTADVERWRTLLALEGVASEASAASAFGKFTRENALRSVAAQAARLGFVACSAAEALLQLEAALKQFGSKGGVNSWTTPGGLSYRREGIETSGKLVALFPGQGSQYVNMARDLRDEFADMAATLAAVDRLFESADKPPLSSLLYPSGPGEAATRELQKTENAQPAIGAVSVGYYKILQRAGFSADFAAGHSFGELTALWAAGALSESDFLSLAKKRGEAMAPPDDPGFDAGSMMAVIGDVEKVAEDISAFENVTIANYNSKDQVVLAGPTVRIDEAFAALKEKGYRRVVKLPVAAACHTPMVGHAQAPFAMALAEVAFSEPAIPVFANGTAEAHSAAPGDIRAAMERHLLEPVRFREEVENLYAAGGRIFVEFGPKNALTKFVENILADHDDVIAIAVNSSPKKAAGPQLRQAVVQLAVAGVPLREL
ncbi:MAG: acyltransferase domain-containing protein [Coriobacteriia bacterium]